MDLRKRISSWLLKPEVERLQYLTEAALSDYRRDWYRSGSNAEMLITQLGEVDTRLIDMLTRQLTTYQMIGGGDSSESLRIQTVKECRSLYLSDPLDQFSIELWTDYAFSERPNLTAEDKQAQAVWDEFWTADRNAPVLGDRDLYNLSVAELNDGELFFAVFASMTDGEATCRTIPTEEIKEIICDPDDKRVILYYRREFTGRDEKGNEGLLSLYYPDWHAPEARLKQAKELKLIPADAKLANEMKPTTMNTAGTDVVVMQAAFRKVNGRGWPLATASIDWIYANRNFLKDRAAVARAAASLVEKIKVDSGQRGLDALKASIGSSIPGSSDTYEKNPPPVAGSRWLENKAATLEWMNRPTNSGDAEKDGTAIARQAGLGFKEYLNYIGHGESFRLATATSMETPMLKSFNRYNSFWGSVWRDMFKIVVAFKEKYDNKTYSSHEAKVSNDRIIMLSQEDIARAATALNDMVDRAIIDSTTAQATGRLLLKTALETMGLQGVDEMMEPKPAPATPTESDSDRRPFRG